MNMFGRDARPSQTNGTPSQLASDNIAWHGEIGGRAPAECRATSATVAGDRRAHEYKNERKQKAKKMKKNAAKKKKKKKKKSEKKKKKKKKKNKK